MIITMAHGSGGQQTTELIQGVFAKYFNNAILMKMEDSAVVRVSGKIAFSTDSFVVNPLVFKGGDIGKLAVCGTVNDLLMQGAVPKYLTAGFIIEEGLAINLLEKIIQSMAESAKKAGVQIVAGDTKVIEGKGGLYINTSGIGIIPEDTEISAANCQTGDAVLLSGTLGDHHACIMSARMGIENTIQSDVQPLNNPVFSLISHSIHIKAMRDVTRGGLGTILNELADASGCGIEIYENRLPMHQEVRALSEILGLDPLYMGNEGKFVAVVSQKDSERALQLLQCTSEGKEAVIIGNVVSKKGVTCITKLGGRRTVDVLYGEGLPRIC